MNSQVRSRRLDALCTADLAMDGVVVTAPADLVIRTCAPEQWLPRTEAEAIRRHVRPDDRAARFAAWGLARTLLGLACAADSAGLAITRDGAGRPHLADRAGPDFNLSHAGGWVAVGLSRAGRIGVDVEQARPCAIWDAVAADFLPGDALALWSGLGEADRAATALRQWCMREAVLKATGEGLAGDLRTLDLPLNARHAHIARGGRDYRVGTLDLADGHGLGFATDAASPPDILLLCEGDGAFRMA